MAIKFAPIYLAYRRYNDDCYSANKQKSAPYVSKKICFKQVMINCISLHLFKQTLSKSIIIKNAIRKKNTCFAKAAKTMNDSKMSGYEPHF